MQYHFGTIMEYKYIEKRERSDSVLFTKARKPSEYKKVYEQHKDTTKILDYTTIVDRLRTVSWNITTVVQLM